MQDRNGREITFAYNTGTQDAHTITDSQGRTTTFVYDAGHRVTQMTDPAGRTYAYTYSAGGDLLTYTDPDAGVTTYEYSSQGMTKLTTPAGRQTKIEYWPAGGPNAGKVRRVIRVTDTSAGTGPTTSFDYVERRDGSSDATVTDPSDHKTRYVFDDEGRATSTIAPICLRS